MLEKLYLLMKWYVYLAHCDNYTSTYFMHLICTQIHGIKGASIFMLHPPFNMSKGFVVNDLHSVYLGVMKQLLTCWFGVQKNMDLAFALRLF